jgi:ribosomal-protein-serine acetyltransferase
MGASPAERIRCGPVVLRRWGEGDAVELHKVINSCLPHLRPWMPWARDGYSLQAAQDFLASVVASWNEPTGYAYAITADGAIIGSVGLQRGQHDGGMEIGYWLHPEHTGRGIVTASTRALIEQAFALDGVDHVEIWHDAANVASSRIPQRLGFCEVGRRVPPRDPPVEGMAGVDVVWRLHRPDFW